MTTFLIAWMILSNAVLVSLLGKAHRKICDLEFLLDGVRLYGSERLSGMLSKGPPPGI